MSPVMRKSFHYDWHWQWNWGDGEMGNWGPHYVDDLRHLLGFKSVPNSVIAAGNRFAWDDDGQTPNMQFALFDYDGLKIVVDIRNMPDPGRSGGKSGAIYLKARAGNHIQFADSYIHLSRGGGGVYDLAGKRIKQYVGDGGKAHIPNFIEALRKGSSDSLNAEVEVGHLSTTMCHMANIGLRAGKEGTVEQMQESFKEHPDAIETLKDMLAQLEGNSVDLEKTPFMLGKKFEFDRKIEQFVGPNSDAANKYLMCSYRWPFVVPAKV
jgi:predicted dehydrogenase